jgi:hypothetical protein
MPSVWNLATVPIDEWLSDLTSLRHFHQNSSLQLKVNPVNLAGQLGLLGREFIVGVFNLFANFAGDLQRDLLSPTGEHPNHNPLTREP